MQSNIVKLIQRIFIPLGLLYGLVMQIRNWLYDWGVIKNESFDIPIVSVGNITAGGTGKTPFTIFLARHLSQSYQRIAIVSRGYGRKSSGLQLVATKGQVYLDAEQAGDEPLLIARSLPHCTVIVSEKRAEGIRMAIDKFQVDLVIMDDAFQHRSVKRNLDILLINTKELWNGNYPIPAGTLREFKCNYQRAQIVVFTNLETNKTLPFTPGNKPWFKSFMQLSKSIHPDGKPAGDLSDFRSKNIAAFAGIAHPENFVSDLANQGIAVKIFNPFPDHHIYSQKDIEKLSTGAVKNNCEFIFCTEKDFVKIKNIAETDNRVPFYAVQQTVVLDQEEKFLTTVDEFL